MLAKKRTNSHAQPPATSPANAVITEGDITKDADRLKAAHAALAGFRLAVEHSPPNARVRTLGLSS